MTTTELLEIERRRSNPHLAFIHDQDPEYGWRWRLSNIGGETAYDVRVSATLKLDTGESVDSKEIALGSLDAGQFVSIDEHVTLHQDGTAVAAFVDFGAAEALSFRVPFAEPGEPTAWIERERSFRLSLHAQARSGLGELVRVEDGVLITRSDVAPHR